MKEIWKNINEWLNLYGGLISTAGLILSIFIYMKTGHIKNNIKNLLNHESYEKRKKQAKIQFESILDSINKDEIFDERLLGEISREVAILEHYSVFFDRKTKNNIKALNKHLNKKFDVLNKDKRELITIINKVIGDMDISETYLG